MYKIIISFIIFYFFLSQSNAQNCNDFHKKNCEGCGAPYKYSGQSKSTGFEKGQKSSFHITVFKNFEYCIQICSSKNLKDIYFRIKEDNATKDVLYDSSAEDNNFLEKSFAATQTKKLIIEVIVPEGDMELTEEKYGNLVGCVGVNIEFTKPMKKGF